MRGAVLYGPHDMRFEDRETPKIVDPSDAVIRMLHGASTNLNSDSDFVPLGAFLREGRCGTGDNRRLLPIESVY